MSRAWVWASSCRLEVRWSKKEMCLLVYKTDLMATGDCRESPWLL